MKKSSYGQRDITFQDKILIAAEAINNFEIPFIKATAIRDQSDGKFRRLKIAFAEDAPLGHAQFLFASWLGIGKPTGGYCTVGHKETSDGKHTGFRVNNLAFREIENLERRLADEKVMAAIKDYSHAIKEEPQLGVSLLIGSLPAHRSPRW